MKFLAKTLVVAVMAAGLAACSSSTDTTSSRETAAPAPAVQPAHGMTAKQKARQCAKVKNQLRNVDRNKAGAQAKVDDLEGQLQSLNCGAK